MDSPEPVEVRTFEAFSVATVAGTAAKQVDEGATGSMQVATSDVVQHLYWSVDTAGPAHRAARVAVVQGRQLGQPVPGAGLIARTVGGQVFYMSEYTQGSASAAVATWTCPLSGVTVTLTTIAPIGTAVAVQDASLATLKCGTTPVAQHASSRAWVFLPETGWDHALDAPADGDAWRRSDRAALLEVFAVDPPHGECFAALTARNRARTMPWPLDREPEGDGNSCLARYSVHTSTGTERLVEHLVTCDRRAFLAVCHLPVETTPSAACDGVLVCAEPR